MVYLIPRPLPSSKHLCKLEPQRPELCWLKGLSYWWPSRPSDSIILSKNHQDNVCAWPEHSASFRYKNMAFGSPFSYARWFHVSSPIGGLPKQSSQQCLCSAVTVGTLWCWCQPWTLLQVQFFFCFHINFLSTLFLKGVKIVFFFVSFLALFSLHKWCYGFCFWWTDLEFSHNPPT